MKYLIRYCCDHYGSLPFTEEYPLNIVMTSAHMMGGAADENLSYMGESFFSSINLNDLQRGASAKEVIAHEIIHQGWVVQTLIMDPDDSCWTPEAFTCYATSRLMEELWNDDLYVDENTLSVNVNRLRKKLEEAGLNDFITTKKGQGYIIE